MAEKTIAEQMREWGKLGGKAKARKYTTKQISNMAKRGRKKRRNGSA
jgi:hypothetical protein